MNINVIEIIQQKIDSLEEEKVIEKAITDTFEKTVLKAVEDSLDSYDLRKTIANKITEQVSKVAANLDFQSYNSFLIEKMTQILNETCREDLCLKAEKKFKDLFLCQTEEIKLSSIFEKYREIACANVDEPEKYERAGEGWHCKFETTGYGWINCELDYEDKNYDYRSDSRIAFTVHRDYTDRKKGTIGNLYIDGDQIENRFNFGDLNEVEIMLIQAVMNKIPIIIDVEGESDIDNFFDVDI